jgi:hypothetical protein
MNPSFDRRRGGFQGGGLQERMNSPLERREVRLRGLSLLLLAVLARPAAAQFPLPGSAAGAGVTVEHYSFASEDAAGVASLSLLTTPLAVRAQLGRGFAVEVSGAYAYGVLERRDGTLARLGGFTDTQLRLARTWGRDRLTLALIAALPTGHATHTAEEAEVADAVAADLLPFRVSNWGTGGGVGFSAAYATTAGGMGLGVSGGYVVAGDFEPFGDLDEGLRYRPGNEATLKGVVDRTFGRSGKASLQATWQHFEDDELEGRNLYRAGDRLQVVASYQGALRTATGLVYAGLLHRERGTSLDPAAVGTPVQDLWLGGAGVRIPLGRVALVPSVDGRVFRSDDGEGQGWYAGGGVSFELGAGRLALVPSARARFGNLVVQEGVESRITGAELGLTLRYRGR